MVKKKEPIGKCAIRGHKRKFHVMRVLSNPYGSKINRIVFVYLNSQGLERIASADLMAFPTRGVIAARAKAKAELLAFQPRTKSTSWLDHH